VAAGVNHIGVHTAGTADIGQIIQVNVTVDKVFRMEFLNKPIESVKTPMAQVVSVVYALWRRVGQENVKKSLVKEPVAYQFGDKFRHFKVHLKLGKLVRPLIVTHGTAKAGNNQPFLPPDL
jgi:hypothetical protein